MLHLALFQPDIAQNTGAAIRLTACLGAALDIIEPCGFTFSSRELGRVAMDYGALAPVHRHRDWDAFLAARAGRRLILFSSRAEASYLDPAYRDDDILLFGRESAGAPEFVHARADLRVRIPLAPGARSLNLAMAAGIALAEARRQLPLPAA